VFRLIFTSRKPAAERFKRWLAHDVLPSLRKSGQYALPRSAKPAPELVYEFPHAEGPLQVYGLKLATVRECRLVHGPVAAARLWRRLELPAVHASSVYEADEGRACLLHLMSALICDAQMYVLGVFEGALWDNNDEYNAELKTIGLRVIKAPEEGLFVVNSGAHDANIKSVFKGTRWAEGKHVAALRKLPGAMPHKSLQVGRLQHRGTFIPAALIDTIDIGAVIENGDDGADNGADKGNVIDLRPN
jgi:hypothetical protein